MQVEVAYALPDQQIVLAVEVPSECTVQQAIKQSDILKRFAEIDLANVQIGIYGNKAELSDLLHEFDRVEIYRPLQIDPKQARFLRVKK